MNNPESVLRMLWNPSATTSLAQLVVGLVLAAVLGLILAQVYIRFGDALSNRRLLARNFLLLAVTTTLIISIVKSSLALSLGLVGALSIVRFRAAIKEPEELVYLFLAISVGLGMGAGQFLVTLCAFAIIVVLIVLRHLTRRRHDQPNLFLTLNVPAADKLDLNRIVTGLAQAGAKASLKRVDDSAEVLEAMFQVSFPDVGKVEEFRQWLRTQSAGAKVSFVESRGLAV